MKGLFLITEHGKSVKNLEGGVPLKICNQMEAFTRNGFSVREFVLPFGSTSSVINKILYRLPFSNVWPIWKYYREFEDIDFIYMRRPNVMTARMRKVLRRIKKNNNHCKILIEIPNYPYDLELANQKYSSTMLIKDKYNRKRMKNIIDAFVVLSDLQELFGVSAVKISNGINFDLIEKRTCIEDTDGIIHICAVAMFTQSHGYERVLIGLKNYYAAGGDRKIRIHFVGEGLELALYKKIVEREKLHEYVQFHGYLSGQALRYIYNISDLALDCFGLYKINCAVSGSLKSREAAARGIPIVTGCKNDAFNSSTYKYILEFPNDDTAVDIRKIIEFRDNIYDGNNAQDVVDYIRNQARRMIDIEKCMENVFRFLENEKC